MARVRIKLASVNLEHLNRICEDIKDISKKAGIDMRGPIPLPTKRLKITTRKSPCGSGKASFDRFEMRIFKRIIDLPSEERVLHSIMRVPMPRDLNIQIEMVD
jgi:small subunit ribosomal protein S10